MNLQKMKKKRRIENIGWGNADKCIFYAKN